jgi:fructose-1,6-bisphosphatase/inositol monophosphatase family enzyme
MSMYSHLETREHKRRTEDAFESFVSVHSEHLCAIVVELVLQLVLIGALICALAFLAAAYARAVVHFTSMMWDLPHPETSTVHA